MFYVIYACICSIVLPVLLIIKLIKKSKERRVVNNESSFDRSVS